MQPHLLLRALSRPGGLQGLFRCLGSDTVKQSAILVSCNSLPDADSPHNSSNSSKSSSSSMFLHRQMTAAATSGPTARLGASNLSLRPAQRSLTRLYVSAAKKPTGSDSPNSSAPPPVRKDRVLRAVPGIGKAYVERLAAQGIKSLDELADNILQQLSSARAEAAFTPAVEYLQGLGIKRQDHAQRIVKHITSKFDRDLHSRLQEFEGLLLVGQAEGLEGGGSGLISTPLTLCVEGNISAGKSTFLHYITNDNEELQSQLGVVHEPVEEWQRVPSVGGNTLNLLDKFYSDPEKYAYTFQNYVFMSRVMQERNSANIQQPVRLMERSVFSDRMVFVRAVKESGWMGDVELAVYDSWFDPILDTNPSLVPDGFIYLRCEPTTCMQRLKMRARSEETTVGMDYLEGLHEKHEDWLGAGGAYNELQDQARLHRPRTRKREHPGVTVLPSGLIVPDRVSPLLQQSLYFLDNHRSAPEMHPVLNHVPALVLDVNADVLRDLDLQRQVQQTVTEYIQVMRLRRDTLRRIPFSSSNHHHYHGSSSRRTTSSRSLLGTQPGAPEGLQQEALHVVRAAVDEDVSVVANSSGQLQEQHMSAAASGNLEALSVAVKSLEDDGSSSSSRTSSRLSAIA